MADRRESRSDILSAVVTVLSTRGADQLSIRTVAAEAGVSAGAVQHHFPTKQALFAELVRSMRQRLRKAQAAAMDPAANALVRLRQGSEASVRFQIEHAGYFSLLDVERADAGHAELLREGGDVGMPVVLSHPDSPAAIALRDLARTLARRPRGLAGRRLGVSVA